MRRLLAPLALAAALVPAAPARAGDPIMPLGELRAGMQCTGWSVFRGTEPEPFGVEILDVVDGDGSTDGPRILFRVYGERVEETGIGPGFSGSPIYCDNGDGVQRNAGAISESVGEYGGKVALATPIESILSTPIDPPRGTPTAPRPDDTRKLMAPLSVSGLTRPLSRALARAGEKHGRMVLQAPAGPLTPFPVVQLRPGSSVGAGYSVGDVNISAIGTVAYTDENRVWAFGHALDGVGARSMILQDSYVYRVINNPNASDFGGITYKLATGGHAVGTLTSDGNQAIAGLTGAAPPTIPIQVVANDLDRGTQRRTVVRSADETSVETPAGFSAVGFVAPLAVGQAMTSLLQNAPLRSSGEMCLQIKIAELEDPVRFCNRYVGATIDGVIPGYGTVVAARAASDVSEALRRIDAYRYAPPHIEEIFARIDFRRGNHQGFLRTVKLPRSVKRGTTVTAKVRFRRVGGRLEKRRVRVRIPRTIPRGVRELQFIGMDSDIPEGDLLGELIIEIGGNDDGSGDPGPPNLRALADSIERLRVWDGVQLKVGRRRFRAFRPRDMRLSGRASALVRVR